jgi:hypothetical protein
LEESSTARDKLSGNFPSLSAVGHLRALIPASLANSETTLRRLLIVVLLYCIPALQGMVPVVDPDIWWHLRTGHWIFDHGRVPATDPFSAYGSGKPWVAYSWLFEILIYTLFTKLGLIGILAFTVSMSLLIAFVLHSALRRMGLPFMVEVFFVAVALGAMSNLISPRSWLFSILFFTVELLILFHVRRTAKVAPLLALPPLFVLWANLHMQFVYGLAVVGLFLVEVLLLQLPSVSLSPRHRPSISLRRVAFLLLACLVATFITPYHFRLYIPIFEVIGQSGAFQMILELLPLSFRTLTDWLVIGLTMAAAFVLGWQRAWLPFPTLLLLMGTFLAFRARRDVWVLVLAAVFIISEFGTFVKSEPSFGFTKLRTICVIVALTVAIYLMGLHRQVSEDQLEIAVERQFPVAAVKFINEKNYSGPLYNHFNWGGYLIWALPRIPVSMDGRMNVHGDQRIERAGNTWSGLKGWESDPELMKARLVIGSVNDPLTSLMRADSRFKLVYEDAVAAVFVAAEANRQTNHDEMASHHGNTGLFLQREP